MKPQGRILMADDDPFVAASMSDLLEAYGYRCRTAPNASGVRSLLEQEEFDLLISDIDMPGNAHLELVHELSQSYPGLPVILLTGHPSLESATQSIRLPVVAYVVKPPHAGEFREMVCEAVAGAQAYRAVRSNRQRLQTWSRDLAQIEELLLRSPGIGAAESTNAFVTLTLHNLLAALADFKLIMQDLPPSGDKQLNHFHLTLAKALRESIDVLGQTKRAFKSNDLGKLRLKLERLLDQNVPSVPEPFAAPLHPSITTPDIHSRSRLAGE